MARRRKESPKTGWEPWTDADVLCYESKEDGTLTICFGDSDSIFPEELEIPWEHLDRLIASAVEALKKEPSRR